MPHSDSIRQRILELAVSAIDEGGEAAVRVNDLAAEAGVTIPTLYRHFGSRDGLVEAAQTYRFRKTQFVDCDLVCYWRNVYLFSDASHAQNRRRLPVRKI